jgi:hypothetical protein
MAMSNDLENATINEIAVPPALLAPTSAHGRFVVTLSSSVHGERPRFRSGPKGAFAEGVRLLQERAASEARNDPRRGHLDRDLER